MPSAFDSAFEEWGRGPEERRNTPKRGSARFIKYSSPPTVAEGARCRGHHVNMSERFNPKARSIGEDREDKCTQLPLRIRYKPIASCTVSPTIPATEVTDGRDELSARCEVHGNVNIAITNPPLTKPGGARSWAKTLSSAKAFHQHATQNCPQTMQTRGTRFGSILSGVVGR